MIEEDTYIDAEPGAEFYDDNFDAIEPEIPAVHHDPVEYESDYELLHPDELTKFYEMYQNRIKGLEDILQDHRREITKIEKAIEIKNSDLHIDQKREKIKDIWEPTPGDFLPKDIDACHKIIIALRKVVRGFYEKYSPAE